MKRYTWSRKEGEDDSDSDRSKKESGGGGGGGVDHDRLGGIPEHLVLLILSLLPFKSAVATSVLSRSWRWLWTRLPDIDLTMDADFAELKGGSEFLTLLHNLLPQFKCNFSNPAFLRKFNLDLGSIDWIGSIYDYDDFEDEEERISSIVLDWFLWVFHNSNTTLQEFRFNVEGDAQYFDDVFPDLPLRLFQIPSLVVLKLRPWLAVHQDHRLLDDAVFNLPNLKSLDVDLFTFHPRVLEKLVSSSPNLDHLSFIVRLPGLETPIHSATLNLSHPGLKRLDIKLYDPMQLFINAPNLEYISVRVGPVFRKTYSLPHQISFVNSTPALHACSLWALCNSHSEVFQTCNFFSVISSVKSLAIFELKQCALIAPITFRRLTHLTLMIYYEFYGLAILHQCPVLEVLTFDLTEVIGLGMCTWPFPDAAPQCLVTRVKKIEILVHRLYTFVDRLEDSLLRQLKYLLATAEALELLTISVDQPDVYECKNGCCPEPRFIKELFEAPRSSAHCRIEFYGLQPRISNAFLRLSEDPHCEALNFLVDKIYCGNTACFCRHVFCKLT